MRKVVKKIEPSRAVRRNGLWFNIPSPDEKLAQTKPVKEKIAREKSKADPRLASAARELRDRWLERVNNEPSALLSQGKYDTSRRLGTSAPMIEAADVIPALGAPLAA